MLEGLDILGVFVAYLTALEAAQSHFAHALLKGILCAEIGQVVVRPSYGSYGEVDFFFVKHIYSSAVLIESCLFYVFTHCFVGRLNCFTFGDLGDAHAPPCVVAVAHAAVDDLDVKEAGNLLLL